MATTIPPVNEEMKKFIHSLLTHMVQNKGSDMFITAGFPPAMKLDGKLTRLTDKPLSAEHTMQIARSIMDDKQAEELRKELDPQIRKFEEANSIAPLVLQFTGKTQGTGKKKLYELAYTTDPKRTMWVQKNKDGALQEVKE